MTEISYGTFSESFLLRITEYTFLRMTEAAKTDTIDQYMIHAIQEFSIYNKGVVDHWDEEERVVYLNVDSDLDTEEVVDVIAEGMVLQWFKPYMYKQENLENMMSTSDFTSYSPAELLYRITNAYNMCKKDFTNRIRAYSYVHGDLRVLNS